MSSPSIGAVTAMFSPASSDSFFNPLECRYSYSATSNMELVHWPLINGWAVTVGTVRRGLEYQSPYCCILYTCIRTYRLFPGLGLALEVRATQCELSEESQ